MRRHHAGSGRRTVLPADWAAAHASVVEGFMLEATVSLRLPGGTTPTWNEGLGRTTSTPNAAFTSAVAARILALTEVRVPPADAVDDQVRIIGYRVSIPRLMDDPALKPGVLVHVDTCSGDALLEGRDLEVSDVVRGTHIFERDLICTLND